MKITNNISTVEEHLHHAKNTIDCFLKGCSHDLKGPIASIQGLLEIARYYSRNEDIDNCLTMIQACANNLNSMIASLQVCLAEPQYESVDLQKVSDILFKDIISKIDKRDINVEFTLDVESGFRTDPSFLISILKALLSNSIAFADLRKKMSTISVMIDTDADALTLVVCDNGVGIKESDQQQVFSPFYRGSMRPHHQGLGLFVVYNLVAKLKGVVTLNSTEGLGTEIKVVIPNRKAQ